jgi:hypothetical protein
MRTDGHQTKARSALRIARPRSSPAPGASAPTALAEGGPRDAAWAAGSGATELPAAEQRAVLKMVDALLEHRRAMPALARTKRKAS